MPTTSTIRSWWDPACEGPFIKIALYGAGAVAVAPTIADAVHALSACLEAHSYETRKDDTGAYNCRLITGGTKYSLHAYGIALDINWQSNPYGDQLVTDMPPAMVAAIKALRTVNGKQVWRWGGDYSGNKDAMHFEVIAHPADLATGIDPASIPDLEENDMPLNDADEDKIRVIVARELAKATGTQQLIKVAERSEVWRWTREAVIGIRSLLAQGGDDVDEAAIASAVLAGLDPTAIAAAIPMDLVDRVADELAERLAG